MKERLASIIPISISDYKSKINLLVLDWFNTVESVFEYKKILDHQKVNIVDIKINNMPLLAEKN